MFLIFITELTKSKKQSIYALFEIVLLIFPTQTQTTQNISGNNNLILNIFFTENDPGNGFILYEEEKTQLPLGKKIM